MSSSLLPDSDSDSDLPDVSEIFPNTPKEIRKGDIVWAKYKHLHWPAFVSNVLKKQKKISVWFTDMPGTVYKYPISKVYPFKTEMYENFRKEALAAGCVGSHDEVQSYASIFLNRKREGYNDDPKLFFDPTFPYFVVEEYLTSHPSASIESFSSLRIPHILERSSIKETGESGMDIASSPEVDDEAGSDTEQSESESPNEEDEKNESFKANETEKKNLFANQTHELSSEENTYISEIITCIKSGKTDKYLCSILKKKIPSFYLYFYKKCQKSKKILLNYISYGPIDDSNHLTEIIMYLSSLYESMKPKKGIKKSTAGNALDNSDFISYVWLPESIIYAISDVKKISLQEAYDLFHLTSRLKSSYIKFVEVNKMGSSNKKKSQKSSKSKPVQAIENSETSVTTDELSDNNASDAQSKISSQSKSGLKFLRIELQKYTAETDEKNSGKFSPEI